MFSKTITSSSQFLMMPQSSQNLYFHLGMNADDDGFCEHFMIMRMTDSKPDDLKVLQAKNFVQVFDDKILIIIDWKENNYLRNDRYTPSKYMAIYKQELALISQNQNKIDSGIPNVNKMDTQVRLGQVRLGNKDIAPALPDAKDSKIKKGEKKEDDVPMSLQEFVDWCKKSPQKYIGIISNWAETVEPPCQTKSQWTIFIKRNLRSAKNLEPFSDEQLIAGFKKIKQAKAEGWLKKFTLETLLKFVI